MSNSAPEARGELGALPGDMPHNMKYETKCAVRKRAAGNSNAAAYHLLPVLHRIAAANL